MRYYRIKTLIALLATAIYVSRADTSSSGSARASTGRTTSTGKKKIIKKKVLKSSSGLKSPSSGSRSSAFDLDSIYGKNNDVADDDLLQKMMHSIQEESDKGDSLKMDFDSDDGNDIDSNNVDNDDEESGEWGQGTEKGALYDAYNLLHTLAQDFEKPFDAPAVVVVGHQSSGKSALIEALMGFQFNQVGGGTKTRRPIALRMQYNPQCSTPRCYLQCEDGVERPKTMSEIQEYIEVENDRLAADPVRCFDSREINVRMEYKYCPNMILIDTPGLIAAPKLPKGKDGVTGAANMQQRALLKSAREAERLVVNKMKCQDYIILCVEDTMDWKHGATREIVQKADPDLSRTVIVNTKLDTKIPQFGTPADVADFLRATVIDQISPHKLGGPFFSSVPSGRVGRPEDIKNGNFDDFIYEHDDEFVAACHESEESDRAVVEQRLKKLMIGKENPVSAAKLMLPRVGLSRLRGFLERRVDECYRRNVAKIVPMLQAEHEACKRRLADCESELDAISIERLKQGADAFCDEFCAALKEAIQGSVIAPPSVFGETLQQETATAGSFQDVHGCPMAITDRTWERLITTEVGNQDHRLYGGAQYHRAMREFNLASRCLRLPTISEDEIANAAGMGDTHDGVNFLRAACVISLEKARTSFDPLLDALRLRMCHIMGKACPISEYMLMQKKERSVHSYGYGNMSSLGNNNVANSKVSDITQNPQFRQLIRSIYDKFIQECSQQTMMRCYDDLTALTKFVTWDMHERSSGALRRSLPDQADIVSIYQVAVKAANGNNAEDVESDNDASSAPNSKTLSKSKTSSDSGSLKPVSEMSANVDRDYQNLLQLMEEAACSRNAGRTNMVVGGLVQHIVAQWREAFCRNVTTKFNCFFLLPFVDEFHKYLRKELQKVYEGNGEVVGDFFDLAAARRALQQRRNDLINECDANVKLQEKFDMVAKMMRDQQDTASLSSAK